MDFDYTVEENAFREEVRNFISDNLPPKKERDKNFLNTWLEKVRAKGWVGFSWQKEFSGSDGGPAQNGAERLGGVLHLAGQSSAGGSVCGSRGSGPVGGRRLSGCRQR